MNPKAFHSLSYGVYIVSTWDNGRPTGCTANCAAQITSSPATVMVSINKDNYTNKCIADCGHFAISVLAENSRTATSSIPSPMRSRIPCPSFRTAAPTSPAA